MGWYLRKSFGLGPLRVNLSKSGVGYSLGVRGARIGVNSRGTYVRMGRGGIYYQKYLDTSPSPIAPVHSLDAPSAPVSVPAPELANVVTTASASSLQDSSASELLNEISSCYQKVRIAPLVIIATAVLVAFALFSGLPIWVSFCAVLVGSIAHSFAARADFRRKVIHLDYALEPEATQAYVGLLQGLEQMRAMGGLWRVSSGEANLNTKYNAGAQYSVKRNRIAAGFEPPPFIATQTAICQINAGSQRLYFLPDRLLVYEGGQVGAVEYGSLVTESSPVRFVEAEQVPLDTQIIDKTWRYTNKGGGPDRRFAINPEIPIVRYASITLRSASGLNYLLEASNVQKAAAFVQAVRNYGTHLTSTAEP